MKLVKQIRIIENHRNQTCLIMQIKKILVVNKFLLCSYYMYMSLILYLNLDCVSLLTIMISFFFVGGIHALYVCCELCRYLHLICEFMWHVQWHISSAILFSFMSMENDNIYANEVHKVNMAMSACIFLANYLQCWFFTTLKIIRYQL